LRIDALKGKKEKLILTKNTFFFEIGFYSVRLSFYPLTLALSRRGERGGVKRSCLNISKIQRKSKF
jgi:hypothetical protein